MNIPGNKIRMGLSLARICALVSLPIFLTLYHDPGRHYLWIPDFDIQFLYQALLIASGLPAEVPGSYGYGLYFVMAKWFWLLNILGITEQFGFLALPPPPHGEYMLQEAMYWARWLATIIVCLTILSVARLVRILTDRVALGFSAGMIYAGSQSVETHTMILRPEGLSTLGVVVAMMMGVQSAQNLSRPPRSLFYAAAGGFFVVVALYAKLAALPAVVLLPLIPILHWYSENNHSATASPTSQALYGFAIAGLAIGGIGMFIAIKAMLPVAMIYNGAIALWVIGWIAMFGRISGISTPHSISLGLSIYGGLGLGQLALMSENHSINTIPIANHLHFLLLKSGQPNISTLGLGDVPFNADAGKLIGEALGALQKIATESYLNFCWVCRRMSIIYQLNLLMLAGAFFIAERRKTLVLAGLVVCAVGVEFVLHFHSFNDFYRQYAEVFVVLGFGYGAHILMSRLPVRVWSGAAALIIGFSLWFTIDNAKRKMLNPGFALHISGSACDLVPKYSPPLMAYMDAYCGPGASAAKPWTVDSRRSFLGQDRPWRLMKTDWEYTPVPFPARPKP